MFATSHRALLARALACVICMLVLAGCGGSSSAKQSREGATTTTTAAESQPRVRAVGAGGRCARSGDEVLGMRDSHDCIVRVAERLIRQRGMAGAMRELQREQAADSVFRVQCHLPLHDVGQRAFERGLGQQTLPYTEARRACDGGFVHGYFQAMAGGGAAIGKLVGAATSTCMSLEPVGRHVCMHSVGHGVGRSVGNDLPAAEVQCRAIGAAGERDDATNCISGALMEVHLAAPRVREYMAFDATIGPAKSAECRQLSVPLRPRCVLDEQRDDVLFGLTQAYAAEAG